MTRERKSVLIYDLPGPNTNSNSIVIMQFHCKLNCDGTNERASEQTSARHPEAPTVSLNVSILALFNPIPQFNIFFYSISWLSLSISTSPLALFFSFCRFFLIFLLSSRIFFSSISSLNRCFDFFLFDVSHLFPSFLVYAQFLSYFSTIFFVSTCSWTLFIWYSQFCSPFLAWWANDAI